ncbi:hypothetical protein HanPSC8_Chr01g0033631 [Helianthus annuus]|nr:hypothetical protein HanPSC8_Chr01g0033631 [Helianthus annuus]
MNTCFKKGFFNTFLLPINPNPFCHFFGSWILKIRDLNHLNHTNYPIFLI